MSNLIRVASGVLDAYTILNTSSYLVENWTRQSDMQPEDFWFTTQPEKGALQSFVGGLEVGSGGYYGKFSTIIEFFHCTPLMRDYIENTILDGNGTGVVTVAVHNPRYADFQVYTGELISPFATNAEGSVTRDNDERYSNMQYLFKRGTRLTVSYLLLESGDNLLTENDSLITLETQ